MQINLRDTFNQVFYETVAPLFKSHGFAKNNFHFVRKVNDIYQAVDFQENKWNSDDDFSFTINVGLHAPAVANDLQRKPAVPDFPKSHECLVYLRLGEISHGHDHWYDLNHSSNLTNFSETLKFDLLKYLFPFMDSNKNLASLVRIWDEKGHDLGGIEIPNKIALYFHCGRKDEAANILQEEYLQAIIPRNFITEVSSYDRDDCKSVKSDPTISWGYLETLERLAELYDLPLPETEFPGKDSIERISRKIQDEGIMNDFYARRRDMKW